MAETTIDLASLKSHWAPETVETTSGTSAWSVAAFSALLDLDPIAGPGDPLPALWHWFGFLDCTRHDELGQDGHPAAGPFMPPIPNRRRMLVGGRLTVREPMRVDETLQRRSSLTRCEAKAGHSGEMLLVTVHHEYLREGYAVAIEEQDIVYRCQPPGQVRGIEMPHTDTNAEPPAGALVVTPDEATLFRFSALTYNTHRIHYDQPYATGVEGYPSLVVHGPLLALLLLEMPRRQRPEPVTRFEFRLRRPVFVGQPLVVQATELARTEDDLGEGEASRLHLDAGVPGLPTSVSGTATLDTSH